MGLALTPRHSSERSSGSDGNLMTQRGQAEDSLISGSISDRGISGRIQVEAVRAYRAQSLSSRASRKDLNDRFNTLVETQRPTHPVSSLCLRICDTKLRL
jgi:hypothetical protein